MKKQTYLILLCCLCLAACGGKRTVKPAPAPPTTASKPAPVPAPVLASPPVTTSSATKPDSADKPGGYYLDDGPGTNPPQNIDSIPNAVPKKEPLLARANKPYKALGAVYTPMTYYQPYKAGGVASWYGKRYHGKKTSSGEVYDMYGMSAAHPTLPLPSYVKVTNPANGRFVIVRVNDRGPFKHNRIIDLSYAAAYKLRFSAQGSTLVEVEAIDASAVTSSQPPAAPVVATAAPVATSPSNSNANSSSSNTNASTTNQYFIQAGAFKNEVNANLLMKKIQGLDIEQNAGFNSEYNNGLYRLKLGPYASKQEAEQVAAAIRTKLNTTAIIINQ
jgi:rare lipoprotein A